jgi:hypothetical protein
MSFTNLSKYERLIGQTKTSIIEELGLCFNDPLSPIWMYRLTSKKGLFSKNFLYLFFENDVVVTFKLKKFKANNLM